MSWVFITSLCTLASAMKMSKETEREEIKDETHQLEDEEEDEMWKKKKNERFDGSPISQLHLNLARKY
jgi:hypothetical protein